MGDVCAARWGAGGVADAGRVDAGGNWGHSGDRRARARARAKSDPRRGVGSRCVREARTDGCVDVVCSFLTRCRSFKRLSVRLKARRRWCL